MRLLALAATMFAFVLTDVALAQAPANTNAEAKELAQRLGREKSAEGLERIIQSRNVDLLDSYLRGLREAGTREYSTRGNKAAPLPADIEAVVTRSYPDPVMGGRLIAVCGDNGWNCQTRALFDLMLAEWRSGKPRGSGYGSATLRSNAPGVEEAFVAWLRAPDAPKGDSLNLIVSELGMRKYAPAAPVMATLLTQAAAGQANNLLNALASIGSPEAVDALLARLAKLRGATDAASQAEIRYIADRLAQTGPEVVLPYDRLRAALPPDTRQYAIGWLQKRKDLKAVPDALVLLGEQGSYANALNALIATDSPEVWKQARAAVEKLKQEGRMNDNAYRYASSTLDAKIASPEKHMAEKADIARAREFETHRDLLGKDRTAAMQARTSNPEAYVSGMREYLKAMDKLVADYSRIPITVGAKQSLASDAMETGNWLRFRLKRPKDALEFFESAQRNGYALGQLAIADTWQFDLRDKNRALAEYRKADFKIEGEEPAAAWVRRWLASQEAYLTKGTKFSGAITENDVGVIGMVAMYGGGGGGQAFDLGPLFEGIAQAYRGEKPVDREEVRRKLFALPPSAFVLASTLPLVSYLPDSQAVLAYLDRHDPAGFASASYFGLVEFLANRSAKEIAGIAPGMNPSAGRDPLKEAAARFARERRVDLAAVVKASKPDPRFASPKATWDLLIKSLRSGDIDTALACMTPEIQRRFKPLFSSMKPQELRDMADSFKEFRLSSQYGEFLEAMVVRKDGHGGMVTFIHAGGNWKIAEM